ncbi:MAG: hypothetical protein R3F65_17630 [bacterium]
MTRVMMLWAAAALFGCGDRGGDAPAPEGKTPAEARGGGAPAMADQKAAGEGNEVKAGKDRPPYIGCTDCGVTLCQAGSALDGLRLDTAKLDLGGATLTGAKLRIEAGTGESVTLPMATALLSKDGSAIKDPLTGLPDAKDAQAWGAPKAELMVDWQTSKGLTGTTPVAMGSVEVKGCP